MELIAIALLSAAAGASIAVAVLTKRAILGGMLLDACKGSREVACMVIADVREDHDLLVGAIAKEYKRGGGK